MGEVGGEEVLITCVGKVYTRRTGCHSTTFVPPHTYSIVLPVHTFPPPPCRVFREEEWAASGLDATAFAARELKASLEGLAKHLFGEVECRWMDTYFPFTGGMRGYGLD